MSEGVGMGIGFCGKIPKVGFEGWGKSTVDGVSWRLIAVVKAGTMNAGRHTRTSAMGT